VQRLGVQARAFVPSKNKHDVGSWLPAAVSSVRKALIQRGAIFAGATLPEAIDVPKVKPMYTRERKIGKKHVVLGFKERADLYMLYLHVTKDTNEIMRTFDVSRNTVLRIVKEGNEGKFDSIIERPVPPAIPPPAEPCVPSIEGVNISPELPNYSKAYEGVKPARTKTDLLNPKVLSIVSRANGLLDRLIELKKDADAIGVDVDYKLKVEL
jgi:hypothetical protein